MAGNVFTDPHRRLGVALVGTGAIGLKHLAGLRHIDGIRVVTLCDPEPGRASAVAEAHGIGRATTDFEEVLADPEVEAVILCTPTPLHTAQAVACLAAGKHVQVEIPLADSLRDAQAVADWQKRTGLVAMVGHTRRFNPGHAWIHAQIVAGRFRLQHMEVQTFFWRRTNTNALGQPRSWTDHLLWHHAAHTVDLFQYQTGTEIVRANALQGPAHPTLGIAMDMSVQLQSRSGALCTLALSFNNDGPMGSFVRYIGDTGTYLARYDELRNGRDEPVDVSRPGQSDDGVELQDREFFAAIREGREPNASVAGVLACYGTLDRLERQLEQPPRRQPATPD